MRSVKLFAMAGACLLLLLAKAASAERALQPKPIASAPAKKAHATKVDRKAPAHGHKRPAPRDSKLDYPQLG